VKLAPLIARLKQHGSGFDVRVITTGQHRGLLDQALRDFDVASNLDLNLMRPDQDLVDLSARALVGVAEALAQIRPDLVLAQGDTTTVLASALACHYRRVAFAHVEAGLRTGRSHDPFPEEKNRVLATHLAELHFAPTTLARRNLLREGVAAGAIHVTGNTGIDALRLVREEQGNLPCTAPTRRFALVTAHRRESFGAPLERICQAIRKLVDRNPDWSVVFPVHPNPQVRAVVESSLGHHARIRLLEPMGYRPFIGLIRASALVLTDSGGVQEEAPALGRRVLVLRDATERPEAVSSGWAQLVGTCVPRRSSRPPKRGWRSPSGTCPPARSLPTRSATAGPPSGSRGSSPNALGSMPVRPLRDSRRRGQSL
jgi:UDP-N-acetylglucosamine 2-epimerase (non-hydrolysing)